MQRSVIPFPRAQTDSVTPATEPSQFDWRAQVRERTREYRERKKLAEAMKEEASHQPSGATTQDEPAQAPNPIVEAMIERFRRHNHDEGDGSSSMRSVLSTGEDTKPRFEPSSNGAAPDAPAPLRKSPNQPTLWTPKPRMSAAPAYKKPVPTDEPPMVTESTAAPSPSTPVAAAPEDGSSQPDRSANTTEIQARPTRPIGVGSDDIIDEVESVESQADLDAVASADDSEGDKGKPSLTTGQRATEFQIRTATFMQRLRAGVLDGLVLLMVNIPFVALIELSHSNFADRTIQYALLGVALILHLFYMTLMLVSAGQTIGMMIVRIVAVDAQSLNLPSFLQALGRALGALLTLALAPLGFLYPMLDPRRRSLSDVISGTTVKMAFKDVDKVHAPWLYHHIQS